VRPQVPEGLDDWRASSAREEDRAIGVGGWGARRRARTQGRHTSRAEWYAPGAQVQACATSGARWALGCETEGQCHRAWREQGDEEAP